MSGSDAVPGGQPLAAHGVNQILLLKPTVHLLAPLGFRRIIISTHVRTQQTLDLLEVQGPLPEKSPLAYEVKENQWWLFQELVGSVPGDVLMVGHDETCLVAETRYREQFGLPSERQPFPCGTLLVVDFMHKSVVRH